MRLFHHVFVLLLVVCPLLTAAEPPKDEVAKDLEKLQGTWKVVSLEWDGRKATDKMVRAEDPWVIKGDKFVNAQSGGSSFKLDPSKKPKAIDITATPAPGV